MSVRVDIFPTIMVLVPADHELDAQQLNPHTATPGGVNLNTTRIVVMNDRIMVAKDAQEGPQVVFAEGIDPSSLHADRNGGYVTTLSGKKLSWVKDTACGCGSRLRSWRPYKHVGSIADPTE